MGQSLPVSNFTDYCWRYEFDSPWSSHIYDLVSAWNMFQLNSYVIEEGVNSVICIGANCELGVPSSIPAQTSFLSFRSNALDVSSHLSLKKKHYNKLDNSSLFGERVRKEWKKELKILNQKEICLEKIKTKIKNEIHFPLAMS